MGVSCKQPNNKNKHDNENKVVLDSILKSEKFRGSFLYQPLSLYYNGQPVFSIGQQVTEIDSTFSFRYDPNMNYEGFENIITDYLSTDDNFTIDIDGHSYISGILFFSKIKKSKQIFNVSGSWSFNLLKPEIKQKALDLFTKNLFPILKNKIQLVNNWSFDYESENQIEHFKLKLNENSNNWILVYEVELK